MLNKDSQIGFTLIELIVTMVVLVMIAGAVLFNYRGPVSQQRALTRQAQNIVTDLRRAQNNAVSTVLSGGDIPGGYGMYFRKIPSPPPNKYEIIFFADSATGPLNNQRYDPGAGELVENIRLEANNLRLNCLTLDSVGPISTQVAEVNIFFKPPDPLTIITSNAQQARINIRDGGNSSCQSCGGGVGANCRTIIIKSSGYIDYVFGAGTWP